MGVWSKERIYAIGPGNSRGGAIGERIARGQGCRYRAKPPPRQQAVFRGRQILSPREVRLQQQTIAEGMLYLHLQFVAVGVAVIVVQAKIPVGGGGIDGIRAPGLGNTRLAILNVRSSRGCAFQPRNHVVDWIFVQQVVAAVANIAELETCVPRQLAPQAQVPLLYGRWLVVR